MSIASGGTGVAEAAAAARQPLFPVDLGWRNIVFSLRTAAAAIIALAVTYWLDLSDPQWATLTVYVLAQPTVGAALSKGTWRAIGTVSGGVFGLVIVALFSQAPELLVAATVLAIGVSFYAGARLRNHVSYGAMLAGYTTVLVAYEGSSHPLQAWTISADRVGAILIGIVCSTAMGMIVLPRYAGDALRDALEDMFQDLATYVATALRLSASSDVFSRLRQRMVSKVVSFDALRSAALFEAPEMRASGKQLKRIIREFLIVLSVARGLFVRIDAFDGEGAQAIAGKLHPTLDAIAARIERAAADPLIWRDPGQLRGELVAARRALDRTSRELEDMAGTAPFEPLVNGLLILNRVRALLHGLAMVVAAETARPSARDARTVPRRAARAGMESRREALLLAVRAALALLVLSGVWMATGWNEGFTAVSGGTIMLFFAINQDNPQAAARTYIAWSGAGIVLSYLAMVFVLPHLEGFGALSLLLLLLLLPAGLMAGTPSRAIAGMAFGVFTVSEIATSNVFRPDELAFINNAVALLLGMVICLAVITALPITSKAMRGKSRRLAIGAVLPSVARGTISSRRGADEIAGDLAKLLPRLMLDRSRDEDFFRGTLSAASSAIELGRLADLTSDPDMPRDAAIALQHCLAQFASTLEKLAMDHAGRADRQLRFTEAKAILAEMRSQLSGRPLTPGPAARCVLRAGASLRFIADRFDIDRTYLGRGFDEG